MHIISHEQTCFILRDEKNELLGELSYENKYLRNGEIKSQENLVLENTSTGLWNSFSKQGEAIQHYAEIKISTGGIISIVLPVKKLKYKFRRTGALKARFILLNKEGEEMLALLPAINWQKKTHEFVLQINDELAHECSPVLILHAIHCANCYLSMINGGTVPALINI